MYDVTEKDPWLKAYWRPAMAWSYFLVTTFDFLIFPLLSMWWANHTGEPYVQWNPITLKEGAFYHLSMGAILGISAWQRGQDILMRQHIALQDKYQDGKGESKQE